MNKYLMLILFSTAFFTSCSTIKVRNETGRNLSSVSVIYDHTNGVEITRSLKSGESIKTSKHMLTGARHIRVVGLTGGDRVYELRRNLKPLTSISVNLNSATIRQSSKESK